LVDARTGQSNRRQNVPNAETKRVGFGLREGNGDGHVCPVISGAAIASAMGVTVTVEGETKRRARVR